MKTVWFILFVLTVARATSILARSGCSSECNLLSSCQACYNSGPQNGCQWCQADSGEFCASSGQCKSPLSIIDRTCPNRELPDVCDQFSDCQSCRQNTTAQQQNCGWCSLPFNSDLGHCTHQSRCNTPWDFGQQNCPRNLPPPGRCQHSNCGDCVSDYLCAWCSNKDDEAGGFCFDQSVPESVAQCANTHNRFSDTECTCNGWSTRCTQCRTRGCSWCKNDDQDYCFNTTSSSDLRGCLAKPNYQIGYHCPPNNSPNFQQDEKLPVIEPIKTTSSIPPKENNSVPVVTIVLSVTLGLLVLVLMMAMAGLVVKKVLENRSQQL